MENKQYGYIEPIILETDYKFGSGQIDVPIIKLDGQWDDVIPVDEEQNLYGLEVYNCTGFGFDNQIEFLLKAKFGGEYNFSDRFSGIVAGTRPPGNDPNIVYQAGRKNGIITETMLPFSSDLKTIDDYYSFKGADEVECRKQGFNWLKDFSLSHDWVQSGGSKPADPEMIKSALRYSPLGVAVNAWNFDGKYYVRIGLNNHWVVCYGFVDGEYWKIFDSYDNTHKKLAWNFGFDFIKRISIEKQITEAEKIGFLEQIRNALASFVQFLSDFVKKNTPQPEENPPETVEPTTPQTPEIEPILPQETPKYNWLTPSEVRHSIRLICDECGLSLAEKNLICQVLNCESNYDTKKISVPNRNGTRDWGLGQFNDGKNVIGQAYWIGQGADFATTDEVLNDPEKNVRIIIREYKKGNLKWWICYRDKKYLNFDA